MKWWKDPAWINVGGTVILIGLTLTLVLQGTTVNWRQWPWFLLPLIVVGGLIAVAILNFRTAKLRTGVKIHTPTASSACDEMADADKKNMFSRVTAVRWKPRLFSDENIHYVEFEITFVNASVFELTSPQLNGIAEFDRHQLAHPPRILETFPLVRGAITRMIIHQPLDRPVAAALEQRANRDVKASLDFSKVRITFDAEFPGRQPWKWSWSGREVSIKDITTFDP